MQTFLPYGRDFEKSAACLDTKRLGKQRLEANQILKALDTGQGWIHHPITKMWAGYENALKFYFNAILREWINRGFQNNFTFAKVGLGPLGFPRWLTEDSPIMAAHKASLSAKDHSHYNHLWPHIIPIYSTNLWYNMEEDFWYTQEKGTSKKSPV